MRQEVHEHGYKVVPRVAASRGRSMRAIFAVALLGCHGSGARGTSDGATPPHLTATDAESARARDELWQRAAGGDAVDLARLADREGATGLVEGLDEGSSLAMVALDALPFADDAEAAYGRLGEILRQVDPAESGPLIRAVGGIARRPLRQREPV